MNKKTDNNIKQNLNHLLATRPLSRGERLKVGIIGGGVAGSTIAIRLAALGIETYLFEVKASLIDGPPMCHLHAGGNLYREIPDEDCVELLKQSIDMLRMYPHSIDVRPTVIAIPKRDEGNPEDLLPRLQLLTREYEAMIAADPANKVLGEAEDYYRLYDRQQVQELLDANDSDPSLFPEDQIPQNLDHWVVNAAKQLDLDKLKFPIVAVQEYGWNIFRLAASAQIALGFYPNAHLLLNTQVIDVNEANNTDNSNATGPKWVINYQQSVTSEQAETKTITVDYLINACGFKTGIIDNMIGVPVQRMVEFKASYVTYWNRAPKASPASNQDLIHPSIRLPEIIIHGKRGTPQGMVQLTPYPDGYYQIHSMNKAVTLFKDGLVATKNDDAQPELKPKYLDYIEEGWNPATLHERSQRAIDEVSEFVPNFATATPTENALYGGQQIPGDNDTLRVADVSLYPELNYARAENVKASSALEASDDIVALLESQQFIESTAQQNATRQHHKWIYLSKSSKQDVDELARKLATERAFPAPMSGVVTPLDQQQAV
ncbi:FAD-dependent oxidoreductase [Psychrobacter sp. UBA3962]|uniref:FAD-dependent oxidoreductase n=1 Tax=Psychrobacter sp. UBA3962 TaxID=1947352 RepID=UPI0025DDF541|nr:FAD-dependent oxidoreductase [Psychrobacter sp. UBA3962]